MSLPHVVWKPQCWVLHSPQEIIPSSDLPETERASDGRLLSTNHCLVPKGLETALQRMDLAASLLRWHMWLHPLDRAPPWSVSLAFL